MIKGAILITGGSGFLGRAILRRAERDGWDARITIYSRDEYKQAEIRRRWPDARCILGDVRDLMRLEAAFAGHDLVIHAAALKYIPEAEHNVFECVDVNAIGSRNVAIAAARAGVARVVGLSTDKAAAPLNTYGMTKALMERTFAEANELSDTRLACVRYGNVVSSTGSVIPLFRQQLDELGEVLITDERMTRFWLSVDEAIDLIALAAEHAHEYPGALFVPRCGAMRIVDLARVVAGEAPVRETGLRPGEKLHETLVLAAEWPRTRVTADGFIIGPPTAAVCNDGEHSYASDDPARWIDAPEMARLIEDAAEIAL